MSERKLKLYPHFARLIRNGRKTWEYRIEDGKRFRRGDVLFMQVVGEKSKKPTGEWLKCVVTYVHRTWPIPEGFVCMSIELMDSGKEAAGGHVHDNG